MPDEKWVFWLNVTNIGLGLVVLLALLTVAYSVFWELPFVRKQARDEANMDAEFGTNEFPHVLHVPELGLTMADGGEPLKPEPRDRTSRKRDLEP